jgi:hypothetical protein
VKMSEEQEIVRRRDVDTEEVAQLSALILFGFNSGVGLRGYRRVVTAVGLHFRSLLLKSWMCSGSPRLVSDAKCLRPTPARSLITKFWCGMMLGIARAWHYCVVWMVNY